jgi:hypothetical protein
MKLIDTKNGKVVVEFKKQRAIFYNKYLEREMKKIGIVIPPGVRSFYEGKDCVVLGDPLFEKAFKEIYFLTCIDHTRFKLYEG